jgi:hypothetical protein
MITTTLGQLVMAQEAFDRLLALKLPIKAAYHLKKLLALVRPELQHFNELRNDLIKELDCEGKPAPAAFQVRIAELAAMNVTLPWGPFDLAWLGDHDITAADLDALGPLVCLAETEAVAK